MNGILLIDKPAGWTSMDVCAVLRGALKEKRIGHSGTLDPMATGLLVVFLGRATRAVQFAESHSKTYEALLRPGVVTDTQDISGTVLETRPAAVTDAEVIQFISLCKANKLNPFIGEAWLVKFQGSPASMITAKVGLKLGRGTATRAMVTSADITATVTSSLGWGLRPSKAMKKGTMISSATRALSR